METSNYELKITPAKTEGKTLAYVKIKAAFCWVTFRLEKSNGKFYLNPPSNFVESLKGTVLREGGSHTGWVDEAGLSKEVAQEIKAKAMAELGIQEEAA